MIADGTGLLHAARKDLSGQAAFFKAGDPAFQAVQRTFVGGGSVLIYKPCQTNI